MTESVSGVYDLIYPSPINLREISSIVAVVELWREGISDQLESKRLQNLDLKHNIQLKDVLPSLPSTIYSSLEDYDDTFRKSIIQWEDYHYFNVFNDLSSIDILSRFDDFSCDWDGTIHYVRTAKRMMMCDRLTEIEKFKIACLYCFEDDIKEIWPSVSDTKELDEINLETYPEQYYWICYLRNELYKIPISHDERIEEFMIYGIDGHGWENRSAIMYFWNRLPSDNLTQVHTYLNYQSVPFFGRFILPKLNKHQLDIFVAAKGVYLMCMLFFHTPTLAHVLPTWMYIRSRIDISNFSRLINELLLWESSFMFVDHFCSKRVSYLFREVWKSAPQHFKRAVLDDALYNDRLFRCKHTRLGRKSLITVLQDASFEERNAFWHENWRKLIFSAPLDDLVAMMKLSFRNEDEITLFKENFSSIYENIAGGCVSLLRNGMFIELNDSLSVCCLDEQKRMELKRRLLWSNYVGENAVFTGRVVEKTKLLNEFINDAFQDAAVLGVEFRNQLTSSPVTQNRLLHCIRYGSFDILMEFVDTFFPDEQVVVPLKKRFFEYFKEHLIAGDILYIDGDKLAAFLVWLLGSEDEVIRFKLSILVEEISHAMMQVESSKVASFVIDNFKPEFPKNVDGFLTWYFNKDEEEIEKFTELFLKEFESFVPRKRRRIE